MNLIQCVTMPGAAWPAFDDPDKRRAAAECFLSSFDQMGYQSLPEVESLLRHVDEKVASGGVDDLDLARIMVDAARDLGMSK